MSVQFGRWNFDGRPLGPAYLDKVNAAIAPQGPDGGDEYSENGLSILYRAYHTTAESRREVQPHVLPTGSVLTFDGRLDNREELVRKIPHGFAGDVTGLAIVAAAYEWRGADSFSMLVGDWALAVWNPIDRSLVLAKDPIGVRPLYYFLANDQVTWSSLLEPLVELAQMKFALAEEYLAGWLSFFPAAHLTPYAGISSVPPSSYIRIQPGSKTIMRYWDFQPREEIRCTSDKQYEEQFRAVFRESVRRRLRANAPVLAELSGGLDSSSIVCMADVILASAPSDGSALETVSYYDDSEPAWDERPCFTLVERQRGRTGFHIDLGSVESCELGTNDHLRATPGFDARSAQLTKKLETFMRSHGNRIILSGIGGDEFTGGVPTPVPEIADLLVEAQFGKLAHQLKVWALAKRSPWFHIFWEALRPFAPPALVRPPQLRRPAPWLEPRFIQHHTQTLSGYLRRLKFLGPRPSFQENLATLDAVRRQIGCAAPSSELLCERRYPYLDRDFLEFMFATPREQLTRPGERRSLMRRALLEIVPDALLNRKRKAFVARGPRVTVSKRWESLMGTSREMISAALGIVDPRAFSRALEQARQGKYVAIVPLLRTLELESWLRDLRDRGILDDPATSPNARTVAGTRHARPISSERFDLS